MGNCIARSDPVQEYNKKRDKLIQKKLKKDLKSTEQHLKILLLGAGGSGKSTIFKQSIRLYGNGFTQSEKKEYIQIVRTNIINSMKVLVRESDDLADQFNLLTRIGPHNKEAKAWVKDRALDAPLLFEDDKSAEYLEALWRDSGIQKCYDERSRYQLNDSTKYYLDSIQRIARRGYIPTDQDILRTRVRTTGIVERKFQMSDKQTHGGGNKVLNIFDVGGQRNERKKWIHCFEGVNAMIFVASLSGYNETLYENGVTNRLQEALNLWADVINLKWFRDSAIVLFLNKKDLFFEEIYRHPLENVFPDYSGARDDDYEDAIEWIRDQFDERKPPERKVFTHVVCAVEKENALRVLSAVTKMLISRSLIGAGLMST